MTDDYKPNKLIYTIANIFYKQSTNNPLVFTQLVDALRTLKQHPNGKIKVFETEHEVYSYFYKSSSIDLDPLSTALVDLKLEDNQSGGVEVVAKPAPAKSIALRKAIESGNADAFNKFIWDNPKFLISHGDTPGIIHEGPRYTAMHVAAKFDQPNIISQVLYTISSMRFLRKVYSKEGTDHDLRKRGEVLTKLFLNAPDKGFGDTPLHFACRFGSVKCVKLLLSYPECDRNILNKYKMKAFEVICERKSDAKVLKKEITEAFGNNYFIPVMRLADNSNVPMIGHPCVNLEDATSVTGGGSHKLNEIVNGKFEVKAFAGPMSPVNAKSFYESWKTNPRATLKTPELRQLISLRKVDFEKGLESHGRQLSKLFNTNWCEYWVPLDCWCDLSTNMGLQKLENYLIESKIDMLLKKGLSLVPEEKGDVEDLENKLHSKLIGTTLFIAGSQPSKADSDVKRAIGTLSVDKSAFPNVAQWLEKLNEFSGEEIAGWRSPYTPPIKKKNNYLVEDKVPASFSVVKNDKLFKALDFEKETF